MSDRSALLVTDASTGSVRATALTRARAPRETLADTTVSAPADAEDLCAASGERVRPVLLTDATVKDGGRDPLDSSLCLLVVLPEPLRDRIVASAMR